MPWCPQCDRFLSHPTVRPDGTCPTCGRAVETAPPAARVDTPVQEPEEELPPVPFHLKALGAATALYLGWRLVQGIDWVIQHV